MIPVYCNLGEDYRLHGNNGIYIFINFSTCGVFNMAKVIDVKDFEGIWTDADWEDLPPNGTTGLKNLIPKNGRLVKSFGAGDIPNVDDFPISAFSGFTVLGAFCFF